MKINITLNGVQVSKEIPTRWHQVTFRQMIDIAKCQDTTSQISLFTGVDVETLRKATIHNLEAVTGCLAFLERDKIEEVLPDSIAGNKLIKDLENTSIDRYEDLKKIMAEFKEGDPVENIKHFPLIVATYAVEPYDYKQAEELSETIWDAPCTEVVALGNFIVWRYVVSKTTPPQTFQNLATRRNKLKRALINWLRRLVFTLLYSSWKILPRTKGMKS